MVDTKLIEQVITDSGLKKQYIASNMNLSPYGLQRKIDGENEFKASEMVKFCKILKIADMKLRDRIFFAQNCDLKSQN